MNPNEDPPRKRRGGRPNTGKRGTFTFRVTDSLRQKLEAEAAAAGRPVSEEVEMRLEASFMQPSPHTAGILALIGSTTNIIETIMEGKWLDNYRVATEVRAAIDEVLNKYMPTSPTPETANQRIAAALLRRGAFGRTLSRALLHAGLSDNEKSAFPADMADAIGPEFRRKMVEYYYANTPGEDDIKANKTD